MHRWLEAVSAAFAHSAPLDHSITPDHTAHDTCAHLPFACARTCAASPPAPWQQGMAPSQHPPRLSSPTDKATEEGRQRALSRLQRREKRRSVLVCLCLGTGTSRPAVDSAMLHACLATGSLTADEAAPMSAPCSPPTSRTTRFVLPPCLVSHCTPVGERPVRQLRDFDDVASLLH